MKRGIRTIIGLSAVAVSIVMTGFAAASGQPVSEVVPVETEGYVLREYCGKVGVFTPGGTEPIELTNIETKNLPKADREEMQNGLYLQNTVELAKILEDLGS